MGRHAVKMSNGEVVTLADWHGQQPPQHGDALLQRPWNKSHDRSGLAFYDSTVNMMRNEQAADLMPTITFMHDSKAYRLFMNEDTRTWHSPEALDIDHAREWKQHLVDKKVTNYADANMAYNDIDNLRLLPSSYNRSRDKVDRLLEGGLDSPQWQAWLKENAQFDPNAPHRAFDPDKDRARRQQTTLNATWSPEDGRSGLHFDTRVKSIWLENELSKRYVLTVDISDAETGKVAFSVPMFRCATTEQLVTRDAFDIDHRQPISEVLGEMCRQSDTGTISKAAALDAYNDVGNLQLVSRSANCSHEWERDAFDQFDGDYDFGIDDLDDTIDYRDPRQVFNDELLPKGNVAPQSGMKRGASHLGNPDAITEPDGGSTPPKKRMATGTPAPLQDDAVLLNDFRHPQHQLYIDARIAMDRYDPSGQHFGKGEDRENIAAALAVAAQGNRMQRIDHVLVAGEGRIFATQGDIGSPASINAATTYFQATSRTLAEHSRESDQLPQITPQQNVQSAQSMSMPRV